MKETDQFTSYPPLFSWSMYYNHLQEIIQRNFKEQDITQLQSLQKKYHWEFDFNLLYKKTYDALLLTDKEQHITWVNHGFTNMTGYAKNFAIGKNPRFLQGKNTSNESRGNIRNQMVMGSNFRESIVNYRKNGEEYICDIEIFPLVCESKNLSHFMAIEKEVYAY